MAFEDGFEIRGTWCQMCGPSQDNCYLRCYIKDGKWVHTEGCPNACNNGIMGSRSLCAKGNASHQTLDDPNRLLYPLRRIGPKGPGARFERISWDEALQTIADTLLEQKRLYGPETFAILSPQRFEVLSQVGRRFLNVHGSPNYLHSAICFTQRQASTLTTLGGPIIPLANSTQPAQMDKTELLVSWGVNYENASVNRSLLRQRVQNAKRGMKVIDIRPMCDPLAGAADLWLPVRPGTDLALALGILHVIIGEDLYDHGFVEQWCYGFDELAAHVRQFDCTWAAQRCGIAADTIREAARMIAAADPCGIVYGNGIGDQSRDGHWTVCAVELIGAITGNLGKPGGGCDGRPFEQLITFNRFMDTLPQMMPASSEDIANGWVPGTSKRVAPEYPAWFKPGSTPGPTSCYYDGLMSVLTGEPYKLRAVFAQCTNPLSATRQPQQVARALEALDFYFVMDMHFNPSCEYADIVLPACSHYECSQQVAIKNMAQGTFLGLCQKIQDPPGEARGDWEFYLKLAVVCGYGEYFWNGDMDACLEERLSPTGYTLEQMRAMPDGVFIPRDSEDAVMPGQADAAHYKRLFGGLPHGKIQCVNDYCGGKPAVDASGLLARLPEYRGPVEGLAETPELAKEYPLIMSDVHAHRTAMHSYYSNVASLRAIQPEPWLRINPLTAERFGIASGDWVKVESQHGWCVLKAQLTECVSPEVLMARRGWWQACDALGLPGYSCLNGGAEVNVLYPAGPGTRDYFHSSMGKTALVRISKSEEGPHVI